MAPAARGTGGLLRASLQPDTNAVIRSTTRDATSNALPGCAESSAACSASPLQGPAPSKRRGPQAARPIVSWAVSRCRRAGARRRRGPPRQRGVRSSPRNGLSVKIASGLLPVAWSCLHADGDASRRLRSDGVGCGRRAAGPAARSREQCQLGARVGARGAGRGCRGGPLCWCGSGRRDGDRVRLLPHVAVRVVDASRAATTFRPPCCSRRWGSSEVSSSSEPAVVRTMRWRASGRSSASIAEPSSPLEESHRGG